MKKCAGLISILCLLVIFSGCVRSAADEEGMVKIIAQENGVADELSVQAAGKVELGDAILMCFVAGDEKQGHTYYAAEFNHKANQYEYDHSYKLMERGIDMYSLMWGGGYVFLSNNENSKSLQILFQNGEMEDKLIAIDSIPFVYYLDLGDVCKTADEFSFEYYFLNKNGEAISK